MDLVTTVLEVLGLVLLVVAALMVAVPLGVATAGVVCVGVGYLLARGKS